MQGWSGFLPAPPFGAWHFLCPSQAKPTFQAHVKPQVFAASSPFRALFTPTFFPPESSWLHPVVPSSKEPASGRVQLATAGSDPPCLSHALRILL